MRNRIYEKDWRYDLLKPIVDWCIKYSYRKVEVRGKENIPADGPVIIAPNHCNTLMDALVILRANKDATVFGARADMFNNKIVAKLMFFVRILPMVRQRDGLRNVLKNLDTQDIIVETLENDVRFCIFPEGRHRPEKSLLPLGKGIFRAAIAADAKFGSEKPVYIIPTGIEYGDFFRYRSTSLVTFGSPINVTEFLKNLETENDAQKVEPLRKELAARMSGLFSFIPDGEYLKEKWMLAKMLYIAEEKKQYGNFGTCLYDSMQTNRSLISRIENTCDKHQEAMCGILEEVKEFDRFRRKDGISIYSFRRNNGIGNIIGKSFSAVIGLPYFIFSAVVTLPMWALKLFLKYKIKDKAFRNTASFGVKLGLGLVWYPILAAILFCNMGWPWALATLLLSIPSYSYVHDYLEGIRRYISDIKVQRCKKLRKRFVSIIEKFNSL